MRAYERKVNQLKDLIIRKYKSAYDKSKEMDIDISSMTYLPEPDVFNVMYTEHMSVILDRVNKIIDDNKDKLKNPTCSTCVHLHDNDWAKRYGKVCCSIWQVCDHYINPNSKYNRKQKTYVRRPSNKACPNYEYGDDNFENRRRWEYKNSQSDCFKQSAGYFFFLSYYISYLPLSKYQLASSPDSSLSLPPKKNPIVMPLVINQ